MRSRAVGGPLTESLRMHLGGFYRHDQGLRDPGFLPTRSSVYDDPDVQNQAPGVSLSRPAVNRARNRPVSPYYMDLSPRIARAFMRTLRGDMEGGEAVTRLAEELRSLLRRLR